MNGIWIRSQDGDNLIFARHILIKDVKDAIVEGDSLCGYTHRYSDIYAAENDYRTYLGRYNTHVRALEIIDEIQKRVYGIHEVYQMPQK